MTKQTPYMRSLTHKLRRTATEEPSWNDQQETTERLTHCILNKRVQFQY